jgi:hypothetical protein
MTEETFYKDTDAGKWEDYVTGVFRREGNYMTFENLYQNVMKAIGDREHVRADEVKDVINMVYLNEVLCCDDLHPLFWLLRLDDYVVLKAPATITGITAAEPPVVTATSHGYANGDLITIYNVVGMTEVNERTFQVANRAANTLELTDLEGTNIVGGSFTAYTSGGTIHHRGAKLATTNKPVERIIADTIRIKGYSEPLHIIYPEEFENDGWWNSSTSRPTKFFHKKVFLNDGTEINYLMWTQCPDRAYTLRYWLEYRATVLSSVGDTPILPTKFHYAIEAGAITRLGENKVQVEAGVVWPAIYKKQLDAIRSYNRRFWERVERGDLYLI